MRKIASPKELQAEIRRLLAYVSEGQPSREVLAQELHGLASRVAGAKLKKIPSVGVTQRWDVMDGDKVIGRIEKNRSTKTTLEPYHASIGTGKDEKSVGAFYDKEEAEKKGPQLSEDLEKKLKWGGLDAAVKAIEQAVH
jgi:hypothetical protein